VAGQLPKLIRVNPTSYQIEQSFVFPNYSTSASNLQINGNGDKLYYLSADVFEMPINATNLPSSAFILKGNKLFYSLGIDPIDNTIYIGDAIDFIQRGKIMVYNAQGIYMHSFNAGIIPGEFYFDY
jgi:hypothetical protein